MYVFSKLKKNDFDFLLNNSWRFSNILILKWIASVNISANDQQTV